MTIGRGVQSDAPPSPWDGSVAKVAETDVTAETQSTAGTPPASKTRGDAWSALYEQPAAMTADWGHHRIYAPAAYRRVLAQALVPIVHSEAIDLAHTFPTCWESTADGPVLSVLRSLAPDGSAIPGGTRAALASLPLAFQAYPVVVPSSEDAMQRRVVVDRVIAEQPTDIGAPLMMGDGRVSRAMAGRTRIALRAGRALPVTRALTAHLQEAGLLEPWPLRFDLGAGEAVDIRTLSVLTRSRLDDGRVYRAIAEFGVDAALFLSAHRLSLFKISALLWAARQAVARRTALAAAA